MLLALVLASVPTSHLLLGASGQSAGALGSFLAFADVSKIVAFTVLLYVSPAGWASDPGPQHRLEAGRRRASRLTPGPVTGERGSAGSAKGPWAGTRHGRTS